jgi:hypothetical protein
VAVILTKFQTFAYAAEDQSLEDLLRLIHLTKSNPALMSRDLLPVYFANLNLAEMLIAEDLDSHADIAASDNSIHRAYLYGGYRCSPYEGTVTT